MGDYRTMLSSDDMVQKINEISAIESVKMLAGEQSAVAVVVMHQAFSYKGVENDDLARLVAAFASPSGCANPGASGSPAGSSTAAAPYSRGATAGPLRSTH